MNRIKEIAETRVRYDYRRIHVLLRREGWLANAKRVCRLCGGMDLHLRNMSPGRRVKAKLRGDRHVAMQPNEVRAIDFVHDQPSIRRPFKGWSADCAVREEVICKVDGHIDSLSYVAEPRTA